MPQDALGEQDDAWLTKAEAAARARVSVSTLDRAEKRGELQFFRSPTGRVRIRRGDVDRWTRGGVLVALVLVLAVSALYVGCRLGLESAHDALDFLTRGRVHCCSHAPGQHRHRHGYVYAVSVQSSNRREVRRVSARR